jgi:hypothetical protein
LKRLKISRKKTFPHPKADEKASQLFKKKISVYELMNIPLIYVDESGFSSQGDAPAFRLCAGRGEMFLET